MGILKTKPLTELLSQTISASVTSALLFTPSGALLATDSAPNSSPSSTSRTNAALAATIWASYIPSAPANLTLELSENNVHIQGVCDGKVLLCLIGPKELSGGGSGLGVLKMQAVALGGYLERELEGWDVPEGL